MVDRPLFQQMSSPDGISDFERGTSDQPFLLTKRDTDRSGKQQPAQSFSELINLIERAEQMLIDCGRRTPEQPKFLTPEHRILTLRGLYYGTEWSKDFLVEKSQMRNYGFWVYTGYRHPPDPRSCLTSSIIKALQDSQDVRNGDNREIDFGHLIIGVDARFSKLAISMEIPGHGATGLEIVTWVGDLGGGTGRLALNRINNPKSHVRNIFLNTTSDYGASINLEGDIAAYLVARDTAIIDRPSRPRFDANELFANALKKYLGRDNPSLDWINRGRLFLEMIGGKFTNSGMLKNREELLGTLSKKFSSFGLIYITLRLLDQERFDTDDLYNVTRYLNGAAREVAEVFVNTLLSTLEDPTRRLEAQPPFPPPTPPGDPVIDRSILERIKRGIKQMPDPAGKLKRLIN